MLIGNIARSLRGVFYSIEVSKSERVNEPLARRGSARTFTDNWRRWLVRFFFASFSSHFFVVNVMIESGIYLVVAAYFKLISFFLVMSPSSGFTALPNELFFLIGDQISKDRGTLNSLTQVSKRCHNFFGSFLYQNVSDAAMPTLALSEKSRLPLTGAHPASFVYKVSLSPTGMPTPPVFQKQLASALKNIALYNMNGAIQSFAFSSQTVSLPEVLGGTISPALRHIEELFLAFPFPSRNNRLSLSLAVRSESTTRFSKRD